MTLLDRPAQFVSLLHFGLALNIANPHIPAGQHMAEVLPPQVLEQMIKAERGVRLFCSWQLSLLFHKLRAAVPCLADLLAEGVVAVAHLVKGEGVEPGGVDLAGFVEDFLVGQHVDDPTQHP